MSIIRPNAWICCGLMLAAVAGQGPPALAQSPRIQPLSDARTLTLADWGPQAERTPGYAETWTYNIYLDGGIETVVQFLRADLGSFKGEITGASLSAIGFGDRSYVVAREYPRENFRVTPAKAEMRLHRLIWADGAPGDGHHLHFETTKNGITYLLDLDFSDATPGLVSGDGFYRVSGGDRLGFFIHIPRARVEGVLSIDGTSRTVTGTAYMDHLVLSRNMADFMCCSFQYASLGNDWEVGRFLVAGGRFPAVFGYALRQGRQGVQLYKPVSLSILKNEKRRGVRVASDIRLALSGARERRLRVLTIDQRWSVLSELPALLRPLARAFIGKEILFLRGHGETGNDQPVFLDYGIVR